MHNWTPVTGDTRDKKETCYAYRVPWLRTPSPSSLMRCAGPPGRSVHRHTGRGRAASLQGQGGRRSRLRCTLAWNRCWFLCKGRKQRVCFIEHARRSMSQGVTYPAVYPPLVMSLVSVSHPSYTPIVLGRPHYRGLTPRSTLRLCVDCVLGSGDQPVRYVVSITEKSNGGEWMRAHECSARP